MLAISTCLSSAAWRKEPPGSCFSDPAMDAGYGYGVGLGDSCCRTASFGDETAVHVGHSSVKLFRLRSLRSRTRQLEFGFLKKLLANDLGGNSAGRREVVACRLETSGALIKARMNLLRTLRVIDERLDPTQGHKPEIIGFKAYVVTWDVQLEDLQAIVV